MTFNRLAPVSEPLPATHPAYHSVRAARRRTMALGIGLMVVVAVAGLIVTQILAGSVGEQGLVAGTVLALLPVFPVAGALLWIDRWEPEPPNHLMLAFAWGATVAALVAIVINSAAAVVLEAAYGRETGEAITAILVAPNSEEFMKGAFVVGFVLLRRHEFDGVIDGIVLAGFSALGFAFTENVLYFGRAFVEGIEQTGALSGGVVASASTFVLRGILALFAHPLFTSMIGIGLGIAATSRSRTTKLVAPIVGYLAAVTLHGLWNTAATLSGGTTFFVIYPLVMVPVFLGSVWVATWSRRREGQVVERNLPAYAAAGWLAPYEIPMLASLPARKELRNAARRLGGEEMATATEEYHDAATELAFLRSRILHGTATADAAERQNDLLSVLADRRRRAFVPTVPPGSAPYLSL